NIELLADCVDIQLTAAERHGRNAVRGEPVGVQAAVGDREFGSEVFGLNCCGCRSDTRFVATQAKRFIIEPAFETDATAFSITTSHSCGRSFECRFDFIDDSLAEFWIMATRLCADANVISHDVGRLAAADDADVARPIAFALRDESMPAALD